MNPDEPSLWLHVCCIEAIDDKDKSMTVNESSGLNPETVLDFDITIITLSVFSPNI